VWFNISAANGQAKGSEGRDLIEGRMTREQIAEAQASRGPTNSTTKPRRRLRVLVMTALA
jgi:hypothetical protein